MTLLRRLLPAVALLAALPAWATIPPLTDSPQGMTCQYYSAAGMLAWTNPGGDWYDAEGSFNGGRPYATAKLAQRAGIQSLKLDVKALVNDWNTKQGPAGALMLRGLDTTGSRVVNLMTREGESQEHWPKLIVEWDDGSTQEAHPDADAFFQCPNRKSTGANKVMKVSAGDTSVLIFPFEARKGRSVKSASLLLSSNRQYGGGTTMGVFRLDAPPWHDSPVRAGLAASYPGDRRIGADPDVIFSDGFEDSDWLAGWSNFDRQGWAKPIEADPENRFEPLQGKALKVTVEKDKRQGLNMHMRFAKRPSGEPEEAYFRYYLRLGESWDPSRSGGKMPGLSGTYDKGGWGGRASDGSNGWSARGGFLAAGDDPRFSKFRALGSYVYHMDIGTYGSTWGWNRGPTGMLEKNRWYAVEQQVKLNTRGKADGLVRAWIDGRLVFERTGLRFRTEDSLRIESVWMNVYHGGTAKAQKDLSLFIDNVVVARRYIGPMTPP